MTTIDIAPLSPEAFSSEWKGHWHCIAHIHIPFLAGGEERLEVEVDEMEKKEKGKRQKVEERERLYWWYRSGTLAGSGSDVSRALGKGNKKYSASE